MPTSYPIRRSLDPVSVTRPCTLRQLLRLLARVVLRVDVGESPWTDGADLYNSLFVDEDIVRHAWRKGEETACGQGLGLAPIGGLSRRSSELQPGRIALSS